MAAGKSDQILISLLDYANPLAQMRDRPLLELDDPSHGAECNPETVNFLLSFLPEFTEGENILRGVNGR